MITYLLAIVFIYILKFLTAPLLLLPDATLPASIDEAVNNLGSYLSIVNGFVPLTTLLAILGLVLAFEGSYLVFRVIKFILSRT